MEKQACPVCREEGATHEYQSEEQIYLWECDRCGAFAHKGSNIFGALSEIDQYRLSHVLRSWTDKNPDAYCLACFTKDKLENTLSAAPPFPLPSEMRRKLIIAAAERAWTVGGWTPPEPYAAWVARVGCAAKESLGTILKDLEKHDLLPQTKGTEHGRMIRGRWHFPPTLSLSLTLAGWAEYEKLQTHRATSTTVFVALAEKDSEDRWSAGIKPAIEACGFLADRVALPGQDGHQRITDQIISRIRRARFLIADVTGERPNVYWEAGFAMGLDIPVIFCCTDIKKAHFNTQQYYHIEESDPTKLKEALIARIQALGLDRNPAS